MYLQQGVTLEGDPCYPVLFTFYHAILLLISHVPSPDTTGLIFRLMNCPICGNILWIVDELITPSLWITEIDELHLLDSDFLLQDLLNFAKTFE